MADTNTTYDDPLHIGIDLGTSRSAVAASRGKRKLVESYVGWPKDFVAQKMHGKKPLFGRNALDHRLSLNLVRPLENGVLKTGTELEAKSTGELIGHLVSLAEPSKDQKICAAVGVPAEALKVNRRAIREAVSQYADELIIVSEPFAVAYGLAELDNAMVIDIGAGTIDFCIMHGTTPSAEDQRGLSTAGDYVDRKLYDYIKENHPEADFTINMVRQIKEEHAFIGKTKSKVEVELPVDSTPTKFDVTSELSTACESMAAAISETAMELIGRFDPEFQDRVKQNIILAGGGSQIKGLPEYLQEAMSDLGTCEFQVVEDPLFAGADGTLELVNDMPAKYWQDNDSR